VIASTVTLGGCSGIFPPLQLYFWHFGHQLSSRNQHNHIKQRAAVFPRNAKHEPTVTPQEAAVPSRRIAAKDLRVAWTSCEP